MQDINELIQMFPEEKYNEVLRSAERRQKNGKCRRKNRPICSVFLWGYIQVRRKTFIRVKQSKYETDSFIKLATKCMFTPMPANAGINKFVDKEVTDMVKEYR